MVHGCGFAFESPLDLPLTGRLPDGTGAEVSVKVVRISHFVIMKALALEDRWKTKDAYDIYYSIKNSGPRENLWVRESHK